MVPMNYSVHKERMLVLLFHFQSLIKINIHVHGLSMTRISDKWLKLVVKNNLVDQFKQTWTSMTENYANA
jgi:hypothetical protein